MKFRVRVDEVSEETQKLLIAHVQSSVSHVLVRHDFPDGHNSHFHMYIDNGYASCQAYRYQVDKLFKVKGSLRSVVKCDDDRVDEYVQYLFNKKKGNIPTLLSTNMDVTSHQQKALDVADAWEAERSKDVSAYHIAQELVRWIDDNDINPAMNDGIRQLIEKAIDIHNKYAKGYCDFSLSRVCQTAMGLSHNFAWKRYLVAKVGEKLFLRQEV